MSSCHTPNCMCVGCNERYSTPIDLVLHPQTRHSLTNVKTRKCPHCDKVYVSVSAYSMHLRTHNQNCRCPVCGKCFSRPWLLEGHIRTHTGERPFKCSICSKTFTDKSNLRAHEKIHSDIKPFVCQHCGKAFVLRSYLIKHYESSCLKLDHQPSLMPKQVKSSNQKKTLPALKKLDNC